MSLKEVKKRHEIAEKYHYPAFEAREAFRQAHQDRAYLLGLVDTMKDMINCSCETCSLKKECNLRSEYEKLESEGGE